MRGLFSVWLYVVSVLVPADERVRWRDEWHADLDDVEEAGASLGQLVLLALGIAWAAATFRWEGATMDGWAREVLHAVRGLLRKPGFAFVAVMTLGLGIGANSAIFSVVDGVVLEPLRYPDSGELVMLTSAFPTLGFEEFWISPPEYMEVAERVRSFSSIGAFTTGQASVGGDEQPERVVAAYTSHQLFQALGVSPELGRYFAEEEDLPGAAPVVVLGHDLWQRSFGGDRDVLGRSIEVNGSMTTVIGVMPAGFDVNDTGVEALIPLQLDWSNRANFGSHYLYLVARLGPGVTPEAASRELGTLVEQWATEVATGHVSAQNHPLQMIGLQEEVVGDVRSALFVLLGAVGFVLLIACANVANLLLARAQDRHKEVAVRAALGAGRGRLLRQFLTEGVVLSFAGAVVGVVVAQLSLNFLQTASPGGLPRLSEIRLDAGVLLFTAAIAVATGIVFGLAPSRYVSAGALASSLRDGGNRSTTSARQRRLRSVLVVSETALALVLAVGAGLMIRSFGALTAVEPGFEPEGLTTFQLFLPGSRYPDPAAQLGFQDLLLERLAAEPGVTAVAAMSGLPPVRPLNANDTQFEGIVQTQSSPPQNVDFYQTVTTGYLETMGIEVVEGRGFTPADDANGVPVVLVNEALARRFYPGESPIGRRVRPSGAPDFLEIVGVVADVKQAGLDAPAGTELYFHYPQATLIGGVPSSINVLVQTETVRGVSAAAIRRAVWALDGGLPVSGLRPMTEVVGGAMARARFLTTLLAVFAGLALLLAAVGTYGVMSYAVAQRARELGIRMAMGARAGAVQRLVLSQGLRVAALGLVLGVGGAWALTGVMESLLFGVEARDPLTFVAGPILLTGVAVAACWLPARRATRLDPVTVLRED